MLGLSVHKLALVTMDLFKCVSSPLECKLLSLNFLWPVSVYIEPITARLSWVHNKCSSNTLSRSLIVWEACENVKEMVSGVLSNTQIFFSWCQSFICLWLSHVFTNSRFNSQLLKIDIYTTCLLYSFTYWLSIHITLSFFLKKKNHVFSLWESGKCFTMHKWRTVDNLKKSVLSVYHHVNPRAPAHVIRIGARVLTNELSLWLCIPVWWSHIW